MLGKIGKLNVWSDLKVGKLVGNELSHVRHATTEYDAASSDGKNVRSEYSPESLEKSDALKKRIAGMFEWKRTGLCDVRKIDERASDANPDDWKGMLAELRNAKIVVKNGMWRGTPPNKSVKTAKPRDEWSANQS